MRATHAVPGLFARLAPPLAVVALVALRLAVPALGQETHAVEPGSPVPAAEICSTFYPSSDSTIYSYYPGTNYGNVETLVVAYEPSEAATHCVLLSFDLTSIPSDATVVYASMSLNLVTALGLANVSLTAYNVDVPWSEGAVTWSNAPPRATAVAVSVVDSSPAIKSWYGLAAQVQDWITPPNYGLMICGPSGAGQTFYWRVFQSDESGGTRPWLEVCYDDPHLTLTATATRTAVPTLTATLTLTPSATTTATLTRTASPTATLTRTASPTTTLTRTASPTVTLTRTASPTATRTPTWSGTPVAGRRCYLPLVRR